MRLKPILAAGAALVMLAGLVPALVPAHAQSPAAPQPAGQVPPGPASATSGAEYPGSALVPALQSDLVFNGVTVAPGGRIFVPFQRQDRNEGIELGEIVGGKPKPYPDEAWNQWSEGKPAGRAFVGINAVRVGPDGALWVVDKGSPAMGEAPVPPGPKIVRIDLSTNAVTRIYPLEKVTNPRSFVDDIRFNGRHAYLTDAGQPGLIVLDLESGEAWRALDGHPSTVAQVPLTAEGRPLTNPEGKPVQIHADQLEVSADGRWFYYQPCTGPMSRIETRFLDDRTLSDEERARHVELYAPTGSTGGTAIDADGNIYVSDTDHLRIIRIAPDRKVTTLVQDPRLLWVDAMWIDDEGYLWLPAAQINRSPGMNAGHDALKRPFTIFKLKIDKAPVRR